MAASPDGATSHSGEWASTRFVAGSPRRWSIASAASPGRCRRAAAEVRVLRVERLLPPVSGPAIQRLTSALSSQNRMKTVVSTQATAACVICSSRQVSQGAAVRSAATAVRCSCSQRHLAQLAASRPEDHPPEQHLRLELTGQLRRAVTRFLP